MAPAFSSAPPPPTAREVPRLLVVDDEPVIREALMEMLSREGYEVTVAADGFEGLERLAQRSYAVVLSDNHMPRMRGLDFLSRLKERAAHVPIIVISGTLGIKDKLQALQGRDSAHYLFEKPVDLDELEASRDHLACAMLEAAVGDRVLEVDQ